jgi:CBS domain-containing protein
MRARDLATPKVTFPRTATVGELVGAIAQGGAVLVVDEAGRLRGVFSGAVLLRCLLPAYVQTDDQLAGVLEDRAAESLFQRVKDRQIDQLLPHLEELPVVESEDSLIEVAAKMVKTASPLVAVVEGGEIIGGISLSDLLERLAR